MLVAACLIMAASVALVTGADEENPSKEYEFNVAINCREYPAFGVSDPRTCSQIAQDGNLNYNPVVGNAWNTPGCPAGWASNQGNCYKLVVLASTVDMASSDCGGKSAQRPNCYWYEDPNSPFKECISNSERFYNMLHRLLSRRGKKDFALNIRYGATAARGQMPFGPYGPAVIGAGNPNPTSMFGVYGHKNPYDQQRGMGMLGAGGHYGPRRQSSNNPWGHNLPGWSQRGQGPRGQPWGQRNQVYRDGNRFNPYRQQNHKQY